MAQLNQRHLDDPLYVQALVLKKIECIEPIFVQSIRKLNANVCFACIANAFNAKLLQPNQIVTFLINGVEDAFQSIRSHGYFIDRVPNGRNG